MKTPMREYQPYINPGADGVSPCIGYTSSIRDEPLRNTRFHPVRRTTHEIVEKSSKSTMKYKKGKKMLAQTSPLSQLDLQPSLELKQSSKEGKTMMAQTS